jgi:hypothetical protein
MFIRPKALVEIIEHLSGTIKNSDNVSNLSENLLFQFCIPGDIHFSGLSSIW